MNFIIEWASFRPFKQSSLLQIRWSNQSAWVNSYKACKQVEPILASEIVERLTSPMVLKSLSNCWLDDCWNCWMLDQGMLEGVMIFGLLLLKEWKIEQSTYLQQIYTTKSGSTIEIKHNSCDTSWLYLIHACTFFYWRSCQ